MSKLGQVREQILNLYQDDGSIIMQNLRNLVDDIDNYMAQQNAMGMPATVLQTLNDYDVQIQLTMEEFVNMPENHEPRKVLERSHKAQEVLTLLMAQSHYITFIKDKYANALPPEHRAKYLTRLNVVLTDNKEQAGNYRSVISNLSKELDYINLRLQSKVRSDVYGTS
jgi:Mg2+ and Co2+ transporter CorA